MSPREIPSGFTLRWTFTGHRGRITRMAWAMNEPLLVSASYDQTVRIWVLDQEKEKAVLVGHVGSVFGVDITPDGHYLASASKNIIKIWDTTNNSSWHTFRNHEDLVYDVAITRDARWAVSGSFDKTVRIYDLQEGVDVQVCYGHNARVGALITTVDSQQIISASGDATIRFWRLPSGEPGHCLKGHSGEILSLDTSPDGKYLISGSEDKTIQVWDIESGERVRVLKGHEGSITSVSYARNGRFFASKATDDTVRIWDCERWQVVAVLEESHLGNAFTSLAFHPRLPLLATLTGRDKIIRVWEIDFDVLAM